MPNKYDLTELEPNEELADFAIKLRRQVFATQTAAAHDLRVHSATISKYEKDREDGGTTPPLGYFACLMQRAVEEATARGWSADDVAAAHQLFLGEIRKILKRFSWKYKDADPFRNWEALCQAANAYLAAALRRAQQKSVDPYQLQPPPAIPGAGPNARARAGTALPLGTSTSPLSALPPSFFAIPGSAPPLPMLLIGREEDTRTLKSRILPSAADTATVLAVHGWPGVGKTTLTSALAYDPDIVQAFPDGVLWTSLGQSPSLFAALASWGRALGISDLAQADSVEAASAQLAAILRTQSRLLIVDDVWEPQHILPFRVGGPHCTLLVTTRLPAVAFAIVGSPAHIYKLGVLSKDQALELLSRLAPGVVAENKAACEILVTELEGLPLAIQVAGRLLHTEAAYGFSVSELLMEIRAGVKLLQAQAPLDRTTISTDTLPTVAVLLQKSTNRLDRPLRQCFAYLGVFAPKPATFDADAMQAIWEVADPRPMIRTLVDRGLLEPVGNGRFWMHALLVKHAQSLLRQ